MACGYPVPANPQRYLPAGGGYPVFPKKKLIGLIVLKIYFG
jgi:hypothetical protein